MSRLPKPWKAAGYDDDEDRDEYLTDIVFRGSQEARWNYIKGRTLK